MAPKKVLRPFFFFLFFLFFMTHYSAYRKLIPQLGVEPNLQQRERRVLTTGLPRNSQIIFKFIWNHKRPRITKIILRKNNKASDPKEKEQSKSQAFPDFRHYYKATLIKMAWDWCKNRHTNQQNRMESPKISLHTYGQLIFNKGDKNNWEKVSSAK